MNVLVTGGAGFIGAHVCEKLLSLGEKITVLDNLSTGLIKNLDSRVPVESMDIEDKSCEEIFRKGQFDTVIHLAAQISVHTSMERPYLDASTNVGGLVNMLDLSRRFGVKKFVFASTAAVYGDKALLPIREAEELDPKSPYGISKAVGELYCRKWKEIYGLDTISLRFSNVYGPKQGLIQEGSVIPCFVEKAISNKPLRIDGDGEQTRDFLYVEDLAEGIICGARGKQVGVYNLSSQSSCSINELVEILKAYLPEIKVERGPERLGDIRHSMLDNSKAIQDFNWKPKYSLAEGLKKTCDWCSLNKR